VILGDLGNITRALDNLGEPITKSKNGHTIWQRDIFLEELALELTGSKSISSQVSTNGTGFTAELFAADLILLGGNFDSNGNKVPNATEWDTQLVYVDLVQPYDDIIDGGSEDDIIFGQVHIITKKYLLF